MRTYLKQFYFKTSSRTLVLSLLVLVLVSQYQNCAPVGDTSGTGNGTSTGASINCAAVGAPTVGASPGNKTANSGLGPLSGNSFPTNLRTTITRSYAAQEVTENCNVTGLNGVDVNCNVQDDNTLDIDLSADDDAECLSGTATVNLRVTDSICAKNSNTTSFQVAVTNVCPQQIKVKKDSSVAPQLVPSRNDMFGSKVASSGSTAVVVAASDDQAGANAGAAFIYRWNGTSWVYQQKLMPTGLSAGSELDSAAIDGNTLVLGSAFNGTHGAAYIYKYNGTSWVQYGSVLAPSLKNTSVSTQFFGYDVAISGSIVVVGSPGYNHGNSSLYAQAGAVFVYQDNGSNFVESKVLSASDKSFAQYFGAAVAISGANIVVGAPIGPLKDVNTAPGQAYVYRTDNTTEVKLNPGSDANNGSRFGSAVDVDGNRAVVTSVRGPAQNGDRRGNVVTFDGTAGWAKVGTQRIAGENTNDSFGTAVALSGNNLLVGAPDHAIGDSVKSGAVYQYTYAGGATPWTRRFKFIPRRADRGTEDYFGESVDFANGFVLGGARADDESDLNLGSAFFIRIPN